MADTGEVLQEADRLEGATHPRETFEFVGHREAEQTLLDAYRSGRMHHAWIIGGEEGIGKATLAYRFARFVLAHPDPMAPDVRDAKDLSVDPTHPSARRVAHLSHSDLFVLRRSWGADRKTPSAEIKVDDARRLVSFFTTTAGEGGWRVAIVDQADDLNTNGANALLKVLEEPPAQSLFLLISTAPKRLLPTIRSRCRTLLMHPLAGNEVLEILRANPGLIGDASEDDVLKAAEASDGSVRRAAFLLAEDFLAMRETFDAMLARLPEIDHARLHSLAEKLAGRDGAAGFALFVQLVQDWLHARMQKGATSAEPRLARWAELWEKTARAAREAEIYNLDRRPLVLALFSDLAAATRG